MKRLLYAILTCLFVLTCAFGCAPNMPDSNPKYKGANIERSQTQDVTEGSTETEVTSPDDSTESGEEGTE